MKILFLSAAEAPDYQCDMLLHGLRSLLGDDVVDVARPWYMYASDVPAKVKPTLYGRGFTMYGLLPDDKGVDRTKIEEKIRSRYFDLIIYGSCWRNQAHLETVMKFYPVERIVFVDGEDEQTLRQWMVNKGWYFKREILDKYQGISPIHFAIPAEKIRDATPKKVRDLATIIPGDRSTYVFTDEQSYYNDYATSRFGLTRKKGGWDCLRHYEIMANGCVPWFIDIHQCPVWTCTNLPKKELMDWRNRYGAGAFKGVEKAGEWLRKYTKDNLTTVALAKYVLDTVKRG
jgi:hypothetical protein